MALSHSSRATHLVLSFSPSFVVLFYFRFVVLLFCFVVLLLRFFRFADSVLSFCRIEALIKSYFISSLRNLLFCRFAEFHFVVLSNQSLN